ncbi:acyl-CoA oxidase [Ascobolus immersus RN42]|uniref:Acyl-coenzyme A oxidase n=1 Tax=Ascobolus immersus RN42 TaxID=1160509 RepID=A0A3N4I5R7_ASCIM|nr:acyl-CoA oxidase [Ascobolus immersus RN42]
MSESNLLVQTRASLPLDPTLITPLLHRPGVLDRRARIHTTLSKDPLFNKSVKAHLSYHQSQLRSLRIARALLNLKTSEKWSEEDWIEAIRQQDDPMGISLHQDAFVAVLKSQGSDAQWAHWKPLVEAGKVTGCYAQTELAHGSNVAGLETRATLFKDGKEWKFRVETPRTESVKWWIGGLGHLANHALVQAQLWIDGECKGPHLFVVPVRDIENHRPLPGVVVGNIGPKAYGGFSATDNGYLGLKDVTIPVDFMLSRYAGITPEGGYKAAKHSKLSYGSMVALRAGIPEAVGWVLAKGVTTAVRYCLVRRQFGGSMGPQGVLEGETAVVDYASVKFRLVPLLARTYATILTGRAFFDAYKAMLADLMKGETGGLGEIHTASTALKVCVTEDCVAGLEEARRACGGHGFSAHAGFGQWWANIVPSQTYEGDNYVLPQQITRHLLKTLAALHKNASHPLTPSTAYLRNITNRLWSSQRSPVITPSSWLKPEHQLAALQKRSVTLLLNLAAKLKAGKPWNAVTYDCHTLARAHAELYICTSFRSTVSALPDGQVKDFLTKLVNIHTLHTLVHSSLSDLLEAGYINPTQSRSLKEVYEKLVEGVTREEMVLGTDAFGFQDWELGVLGREDGGVYGGLWEEVRSEERGREAEEARQVWLSGRDGKAKL